MTLHALSRLLHGPAGYFFAHTLLGRTAVAYVLISVVPIVLPLAFVKLVGISGLRNIFSFEPRDTALHRLDPRLKVLYAPTVGMLSVFLNWDWVYALLGLTLLPWIVLRPSGRRIRILLTMTIAPALGSIWSQGLYHTSSHHLLVAFPWTMAWVGTPGLSVYGLQYGLQEAGRLLVASSASLVLVLTTQPSEIVWACMRFRMPQRVGLALSVALRFLPQIFERLNVLIYAVQARGYDFSRPRHAYQLRGWFHYTGRLVLAMPIIVVPLLIGALQGTTVMAMVADARAFDVHPRRGTYRVHRLERRDVVAWSAYAAVIGAVACMVALHVGVRHGYG